MSWDSSVCGSISQDGIDDGSLAIFGLDNYSGARKCELSRCRIFYFSIA